VGRTSCRQREDVERLEDCDGRRVGRHQVAMTQTMSNFTLLGCSFLIGAATLASCGSNGGYNPPIAMAHADAGNTNHHTFYYTGTKQTFKVPTGVKAITVVAHGAAGGIPDSTVRSHGRGGRVFAIIPVQPGETLTVIVGGEGTSGTNGSGYNGGATGGGYATCSGSNCEGYGGGGASDIREGGSSLADRVLVAGGGGGASGTGSCAVVGGAGGGDTGGSGGSGCATYSGGGGGDGGTQTRGGNGGHGAANSYGSGGKGVTGKLALGGAGGDAGGARYCSSSCTYNGAGGGGGGGYYGGGGGGGGAPPNVSQPFGNPGGGGGGGSSYVESKASKVKFWQNWQTASGNGLVVFSW
jgi:hypothetical protein